MKKTLGTMLTMVGVLLVGGVIRGSAAAQQIDILRQGKTNESPVSNAPATDMAPSTTPGLRSTATPGPGDGAHGEALYYMHCNFCHVQNANLAPPLSTVFRRKLLMTGKPVSEDTVMDQIRNGSTDMPEMKYSLTEQDIRDLVTYFKSGKCCTSPNNPPQNPRYRAEQNPVPVEVRSNLSGGPTGLVRTQNGDPLEGMMVQLVSTSRSVRTTVFSNESGKYQFPKLASGVYTLRILRPLEFKPAQGEAVPIDGPTHTLNLDPKANSFQRESLKIDGANHLEDIVLERGKSGRGSSLAPIPENAVQLTGVEWFMNLAGSGEEKARLGACLNCHSTYQIVRNRHTEQGWRLIIDRMFHMTHVLDTRPDFTRGATLEDREILAKFLGRVRGPNSSDDPYVVRPRPAGDATKVIVTEYELPSLRHFAQEVDGDSKGNVWYISERGPYFGKLDPRTGIVTDYKLPSHPDAYPGANTLAVDKNDIVWMWEGGTWNNPLRIVKFDPRTEKTTEASLPLRDGDDPVRTALSPDGTMWGGWNDHLDQIDLETGKILKQYPYRGATFATNVSLDGKYVVSGGTILDTMTGKETQSRGGGGGKGGFDKDYTVWSGGRGGLVGLNASTGKTVLFMPPTPYVFFSEASPDKNGEVWSAYDNGGHVARLNPRTGKWIEYETPDPYPRDQRTWIDNSTNPVSIWYVNLSEIVHIQPMQ